MDIRVCLHQKVEEFVGKCQLSVPSTVCMCIRTYVLTLVNSVMFLPISLALIIFHAKHHNVCAGSSSSSYAFMAI